MANTTAAALEHHPRPTAALPQPAVEALSRIEAHFPLVRAVTCYTTAEARANELIAAGRKRRLSDLDADDLAHSIDLMAGMKAQLKAAGRLDLIEAAR